MALGIVPGLELGFLSDCGVMGELSSICVPLPGVEGYELRLGGLVGKALFAELVGKIFLRPP